MFCGMFLCVHAVCSSTPSCILLSCSKLLPVKIQSVVEDVAEDFMKRLNPEHDAEMRGGRQEFGIVVNSAKIVLHLKIFELCFDPGSSLSTPRNK